MVGCRPPSAKVGIIHGLLKPESCLLRGLPCGSRGRRSRSSAVSLVGLFNGLIHDFMLVSACDCRLEGENTKDCA